MSKDKTTAEWKAKKPNKAIQGVKNAYQEANNLLKNIQQFAEAVALLILAYAGFWTAFNTPLRNEYKYVLMFSAVLVGLRGAWEFLKSINKK